jgi:hypothetical protein
MHPLCTAVHHNAGNLHFSECNAGIFHSNAQNLQIMHVVDTPMALVTDSLQCIFMFPMHMKCIVVQVLSVFT